MIREIFVRGCSEWDGPDKEKAVQKIRGGAASETSKKNQWVTDSVGSNNMIRKERSALAGKDLRHKILF